MSTKTQMYSELAEKASKELTHSVNEWCLFLKSQAKLYKYPYADQLMIYAQRPDASLCLTFDDWTQTMNRYIHKGAKGIGLVDYSGDAPKMKYVFDISDISERYNSRAINVWKCNPDAEKDVIEALSDFYGIDRTESLDVSWLSFSAVCKSGQQTANFKNCVDTNICLMYNTTTTGNDPLQV